MIMKPIMSKLNLTLHIISSVGWLGSVACFLALAITGLINKDEQVVRSMYLAMDLTAWFIIVPLCFASLFTGVIQALGTKWGLFRHYWILIKLLMTVIATILLLLHMQPISHLANIAMDSPLTSSDLDGIRIQLVVNAAAGLLVLIVATILSVYKPNGMTRYGWRKQREKSSY